MPAIYFDMDGTIAALYDVKGWENKLNAHDASPYFEAQPLGDLNKLRAMLDKLAAIGYTIGVVSWLAKNSSYSYDWRVRQAKKYWLKKYLPIISECHIIKYGTPKRRYCKIKDAILVDDDASVRQAWNGQTIDASNFDNILKSLEKLLDKEVAA